MQRCATRSEDWHSDPASSQGLGIVACAVDNAGKVRDAARVLGFVVVSLSMLTCACAPRNREIFADSGPELAWPAPPHVARIRYVGQIRTSDDLKRPQVGSELFGRIFGGRKAPDPLYGPRAVTVTDAGSKVWVADPGGRCVHLFDLITRRYTKIERVGATRLVTPVAICPGPAGSVYVADSEGIGVHRLSDRDGSWIESLRLPEEMLRPAALCYDEAQGELYVVDVLGHDIKVFDGQGTLVRVLGTRGEKPGQFNFPSAIAASSQLLWIADTANNRIQGIKRDGEPVVVIGQVGDAPGDMAMPKAVALDPEGHLYVVDGRFENIQIFSDSGELLLFFGEEGTGRGQFWLPGGLWIEPSGRIWVCDSYNRRLQVFQYVRELEADF